MLLQYSIPIVAPPSGLLALWPDPLPEATLGAPYYYQLTASGGIPPYTFAITSGALPAGLTLNSATGEITGTPTSTVTLDAVTFTVTDSGP
jgi:large repetitive protein